MIRLFSVFVFVYSLFFSVCSIAAVSTFEDLVLPSPQSNFASTADATFSSGGVTFKRDYNETFQCCWSGWTFSNRTDITTLDYNIDTSAYAGSGQGGTSNYAVAYIGPVEAALAGPSIVSGAWITNTTYAALAMRDSYFGAKKFGGASGDDADFFKLTITGFNGAAETGSVDFYLADYRFGDNSLDYIVQQWTFVNLASLGTVTKLGFALSSSDVGQFGMNTPAYFAIDTLTTAPVPEPGHYAMLLAGLALLGVVGRKRVAG